MSHRKSGSCVVHVDLLPTRELRGCMVPTGYLISSPFSFFQGLRLQESSRSSFSRDGTWPAYKSSAVMASAATCTASSVGIWSRDTRPRALTMADLSATLSASALGHSEKRCCTVSSPGRVSPACRHRGHLVSRGGPCGVWMRPDGQKVGAGYCPVFVVSQCARHALQVERCPPFWPEPGQT
jgi:hypothetical protein